MNKTLKIPTTFEESVLLEFDEFWESKTCEYGGESRWSQQNLKELKQFISQTIRKIQELECYDKEYEINKKDNECIEALRSATETNDNYWRIKMKDQKEELCNL